MKLKKYILLFTLGIATGEILTFLNYSLWLEMGIMFILAIILTIICDKL